mgnify:CR=1 FL=1
MTNPLLFSAIDLREVRLKNRIVVAPMHQYSGVDGFPVDWHLMNAGRFAAGGSGLVIIESTKIERRGCGTLGDVGYVNERGFLFLTDRAAYTIISGGVNIYPQEAEDLLVCHPDVADCAVFGVPDEEMGEAVKAVVQLSDASAASDDKAAELIGWLRERLSHIKAPRSIDFREDLPRTATGKLMKRLLKDEYWAEARKKQGVNA